ncbi:hypothetical protein HY224_01080 [Candidatus Uhrbacteria bacterium]|nr:hypothetical protein [Candidatus Uhrbacteria bacterium]
MPTLPKNSAELEELSRSLKEFKKTLDEVQKAYNIILKKISKRKDAEQIKKIKSRLK